MAQRNYEIDAIKGFAIFLVVLGHVIFLLVPNDGFHNSIMELARMIYTFHVRLFFFISGYLIFPTFGPNLINWTKKKFMALIIPYINFTIIYFYFLHGFSLESIASNEARWWFFGDLIHKLGSFITPDSAWFLPVLFELFVSIAIIITFETKMGKYGKYVFPAFFLLFLIILPISPIARIKGVDQFIMFLPFVMGGYYINYFEDMLVNTDKKNHHIIYLIGFSSYPLLYFIQFITPLVNINGENLLSYYYYTLLSISGILLSILFIKLLTGKLIRHIQTVFAACGIYSMEIYLTHLIVLYYFVYYHLSLWPNSGIIGVFMGTLSILLVSLAISFVLSYNKWVSRLFFARWSFKTIMGLFKMAQSHD